MFYDHVTRILESGGVLTLSQQKGKLRARMHSKAWEESIDGDGHTTLPDAITSLNTELENVGEDGEPIDENNTGGDEE